jgi:PhnB protein
MSSAVSPVPKGFHTLTPHIVVNDAKAAADFYHRAFGAEVMGLSFGPDGKVMHAQVRIGDSILMFADEYPEWNSPAPSRTKTDTCVRLHLYVEDADKVFASAVEAGAKVVMPLETQFWGDRYGQVLDPFGHRWSIATHVKDLTQDEMKVAAEAAMTKATAKKTSVS